MPSRRPAKPSWDHALRLATRHIMHLGHWHGRFASGPRYGAFAHDKKEDADNSVPRLTPNTPSISTSIRWAESTCPPPSSTSSRSTPLNCESQPQRAKPLRHAISVCVKAQTPACRRRLAVSCVTVGLLFNKDSTCRPISPCSLSRHSGRAPDVLQPCNAMPARSGTASDP